MDSMEGVRGNLVGFGKYANLTYYNLVETDRGYVNWLFNQSWFQSTYPALYEYLDSLGLRSDVSPSDHNTFQSKFADDEELVNLVKKILGEDSSTLIVKDVVFEHLCNADISVDVEIQRGTNYFVKDRVTLLIELKPTVSNEYPEILRQMRIQRRSYDYFSNTTLSRRVKQALVIQSYTGDIDIDVVRKIFGDINIVVME